MFHLHCHACSSTTNCTFNFIQTRKTFLDRWIHTLSRRRQPKIQKCETLLCSLSTICTVHLPPLDCGSYHISWKQEPCCRRETARSHVNVDMKSQWGTSCERCAIAKTAQCALAPVRGCPENFRGSLTTPTATIPTIFHGLLFQSAIWMFLQNLKSVALPVPEIIGGTQKILAATGYAHAPFSPIF